MLPRHEQRTADFTYAERIIPKRIAGIQVKDPKLAGSQVVIVRIGALHGAGGGGDPDLPVGNGR